MNWLKKQTNKGKQQLTHGGGRHQTANSAQQLPRPPPKSLDAPATSTKLNRAHSDVTSPRARRIHKKQGRPRNPVSPVRKRTESFAAHMTEFGNTDDMDNLFSDEDIQENDNDADTDDYGNSKRKPKGSFATHLSDFVGNDKSDLAAVVDDINTDISTSAKEKPSVMKRHNHTLPLNSYKERFTVFMRNHRERSGTITKLKNELAEETPRGPEVEKKGKKGKKGEKDRTLSQSKMTKTKNKYKKRTKPEKQPVFSFIEEEDHGCIKEEEEEDVEEEETATVAHAHAQEVMEVMSLTEDVVRSRSSSTSSDSSAESFTSMISNSKYARENDEWYQYLVSIHDHLSQHVQYFASIPAEMTSGSAETDLKHDMERTYTRILITKMKHWIEGYGVAAIVSHQEVFELKKQLIKSNEEANALEEESVQLTQKVFGMEHQLNSLKESLQRQENEIEILHKAIQSYKIEIKDLQTDVGRLTPRSIKGRTPPPPSQKHRHVPVLRLSSSADMDRSPHSHASPPPPPPPGPPPRSPPQSPTPLKQSYSENMMLDVDPCTLDRQKSQPQPTNRLKPLALRQGRHSQPMMKLKKDAGAQLQKKDELAHQNDSLVKELNTLREAKTSLETQVRVLKTLMSDMLGNVDQAKSLNHEIKKRSSAKTDNKKNELMAPPTNDRNKSNGKNNMKKRKSLINFIHGRKSTPNLKINKSNKSAERDSKENLTKLVNEMRQEKYGWAKEKNALKEEIQRLKEKIKDLESTGHTTRHRALDSEDLIALNVSKEAVARTEKKEAIARKENAHWKQAASFHDRLNNFAINEACSMDDVLNAISADIKVDRELTETELSGLEYIGDEKRASSATEIVVTAEIDEYENSDDGWVSSEGGNLDIADENEEDANANANADGHSNPQDPDVMTTSCYSNFVLSQSTTQSILTSSVSSTARRAPLHRKPAKITKVMIPKTIDKKKNIPRKKLPPPPPNKSSSTRSVAAENATTVIANVKRTKRRFFHPTKHGFLCLDDETTTKVYAAIDGLPSSTNLNQNEPNWKKRKDKDILVPFLCLFGNKNDYENLTSLTAHKSVRDILFQNKFAQYCTAFIRLDTATVHWNVSTLLKDLEITRAEDSGGGGNSDCKLFVASNVDSQHKENIEIHTFIASDETNRNQWLSAIQGMMDRRRQSARRRSLCRNTHQNPHSGRYKMKLF